MVITRCTGNASSGPNVRPAIKNPKIDYAGGFLIAASLVALLLALVWGGGQYAWGSPVILGLFAAAAGIFGLFAMVERAAPQPILPLDLFGNRAFAVSMAATFLSSVGLYGAVAFLPLYAQSVVGFSATNSGLVLAPMMISLVISSAIA